MSNTNIMKYESGLDNEKHNALANKFNPYAASVQDLICAASKITVNGVEDVTGMKSARETRLKLKTIRVDVEKVRKEMKESCLREGKAIDGMANIIKYMIVPVEEKLQEMEDVARREEEKRVAALVEDRRSQLCAFDVDSTHFDLASMEQNAFDILLASSEAGYKARIAAEKAEAERIEAERVKAEKAAAERRKAEAEERARIEAENAKLKKEAEEREKEMAKERAKAEKERIKAEAERAKVEKMAQDERNKLAAIIAEKEERERKEAEKKAADERAKIESERDRLAAVEAERLAKLSAPDIEKMETLLSDICAITMPAVNGDVAIDALHKVRAGLNAAVKTLRAAIKSMKHS